MSFHIKNVLQPLYMADNILQKPRIVFTVCKEEKVKITHMYPLVLKNGRSYVQY